MPFDPSTIIMHPTPWMNINIYVELILSWRELLKACPNFQAMSLMTLWPSLCHRPYLISRRTYDTFASNLPEFSRFFSPFGLQGNVGEKEFLRLWKDFWTSGCGSTVSYGLFSKSFVLDFLDIMHAKAVRCSVTELVHVYSSIGLGVFCLE